MKEKLTIDQAAAEARREHLIGDYYSLDDHTTSRLIRLMARTKWRQSRSSAAAGHSRTYAFHQALKRRR